LATLRRSSTRNVPQKEDLNEHIQRCTPELLFNLDAVGSWDEEVRKTKRVIIGVTVCRQMIHHGISRNFKYISVIAFIPPTGKSLILDIVTSQDSASVREELKKHGVRFGRDVVLESSSKPEIKPEIFFDCIWTIFSLNLAGFLMLDEFGKEIAPLLMDN
jgi:hypothetical protein